MGRPRKIEVIEADNTKETEWEEIDSDPEVDRVKAELGDKAKSITIQSYNRQTRKWDYLEKLEVGAFSLEYVKHTYGGGEYRARILDGDNKYIGHYSFSISSRFTASIDAPLTPSLNSQPVLINTQNDKFDRIERMLEKLIEVQTLALQKQDKDPLDIALKIAEIVKTNTPQQAPSSTSWSEAFQIFKQGMELGTMGAEGGTSYLPVIEKIGQPALELLNKIVNNDSDKILRKAKEGINNSQSNGGSKIMSFQDYLKKYIPIAVNLAVKGKDPELYADLLLDQIPQSFYEEIYNTFSRPDIVDILAKDYPILQPHTEWFKLFVSRVIETLTPETSVKEDESVVEG